MWLASVMVATVGVLLVAHVAEVVLWSVTYVLVDAAPSEADVLYFAFVNYTTLGYGDVLPVARWRLLGPITAMNGILLFGWSTAVIFEVMEYGEHKFAAAQRMDHAAEPTAARCVGLLLDHSRSSSLRHRRQAVCTELQDELSLCPGRGGVLCCAGSRSCERAGQASIATAQGAWVPEGSSCANAFFKQGTAIHFARPGSSKREGILILGNRIEDSRQRCTISKAKMEADRHTLFITCFSGLFVSKLAFSLEFAGRGCGASHVRLTSPKIRCVGAAAAFRAGVRFRPALVLIRRLSRRRTRCKSGVAATSTIQRFRRASLASK